MRSRRFKASRRRATAVCIWGSKNGSLSELRRGRRNAFTSSAQRNPFRKSNRAIHSNPQISLHVIPDSSAFSSSGCAMTHRLCGRVNFPRDCAATGFSSARSCRVKLLGPSASIGLSSTRLCTDQLICERSSDKIRSIYPPLLAITLDRERFSLQKAP